jgi:hypothetical protein
MNMGNVTSKQAMFDSVPNGDGRGSE